MTKQRQLNIISTIKAFALVAILLVSGCRKSEHNSLEGIEYRDVLVYYNNGKYIDNGYILGGYQCNQTCEYPLITGGQTYSHLCKVSYTFTLYDNFAGYDVLLQYNTVDSLTHFAVDSFFAGMPAYYHKDQANLYALFAPQLIRFASHPDSLGSYISFTDRNNSVQFTSIPNAILSVNTDSRFYFRFIDTTRVSTYGAADEHSPAFRHVTHKISARGQFSAVLYAIDGDSIVITDGEFRLPFCE